MDQGQVKLKIFIQNEAGANQKHYHNEKTLEWLRSAEIARPYPFPYGFIIGTTSADGDNLDCFVITAQRLRTGQIVEGEAVGLMEQIEDGEDDHKVLARLCGEEVVIDANVRETLTDFVRQSFKQFAGMQVRVGEFVGREAAEATIVACRDDD